MNSLKLNVYMCEYVCIHYPLFTTELWELGTNRSFLLFSINAHQTPQSSSQRKIHDFHQIYESIDGKNNILVSVHGKKTRNKFFGQPENLLIEKHFF